MTIKEEVQFEEYKRAFAEAYKQGFMDAMSMCKTEPQYILREPTDEEMQAIIECATNEHQTDCSWK